MPQLIITLALLVLGLALLLALYPSVYGFRHWRRGRIGIFTLLPRYGVNAAGKIISP